MKNITNILLVAVFFNLLPAITQAQNTNEVKSNTEPINEIIDNGHELIIKQLVADKKDKANETYYSLQETAKKNNQLAFSYIDIIYINILTNNWDEGLKYAAQYKEKTKIDIIESDVKITNQLHGLIEKNNTTLEEELDDADITEADKDIIKLVLYAIENKTLGEEYENKLADHKTKYPNSEYTQFRKHFLPIPPVKFLYSIGVGTALIVPTGNFGDNFKSSTLFSFSMDVKYDWLYSSVYINYGNTKLKEDISYVTDLNFSEGDKFSYFESGIQFGYLLVRNDWFHLAPYAAIAGSALQTNVQSNSNNDEPEYNFMNTFAYGGGLHTQVKLIEGFARPNYYNHYSVYPIQNSLSLKCNIGYNFLNNCNCSSAKGDLFYAQVALVWGFGIF